MRLLLKTLFFSVVAMQFACAQKIKKTAITNVYAFSETHHPGNLPVDENGNPLGPGTFTTYTIYIETSGTDTPKWEKAFKADMSFPIAAVQEVKTKENVGTAKQTGKAVTVQPTTGNRLWKLELGGGEPTARNTKSGDALVISGKSGRTPVTYTVKTITELESLPRY